MAAGAHRRSIATPSSIYPGRRRWCLPRQRWRRRAMVDVIRASRDENPIPEARREWLVTNGLGGFASATISGEVTRRYHGFLIAALPAPQGRLVMLNDLDVAIERRDGTVANVREAGRFVEFTQAMGLPSWRYEIDGVTIEKSVVMPARRNIVHISFRLIGADRPVRLQLRPFVNFRQLEAPVNEPLGADYQLLVRGQRYEISAGPDLPTLRLMMNGCEGSTFTADGGSRRECFFLIEAQRGYEARGWAWCPGHFSAELRPDCTVALIAATERWHVIHSLTPAHAREFETERRHRLVALAKPKARKGLAAELVLAADTFVITPVGRIADIARAQAGGDAAAWQGGRDQRALVQRALPVGRVAEAGGQRRGGCDREARRNCAPVVQPPFLVRGRRLSLRRGRWREWRRRVVSAEPDLRDITAAPRAGRRALGGGRAPGPRQAADAGRAALAGARRHRIQAALFRRSACPRCGLSPGDRLGLAGWPVH